MVDMSDKIGEIGEINHPRHWQQAWRHKAQLVSVDYIASSAIDNGVMMDACVCVVSLTS